MAVSSKRSDIKWRIGQIRSALTIESLRANTALVTDWLWKRMNFLFLSTSSVTDKVAASYTPTGDTTLPSSEKFIGEGLTRFDVTNNNDTVIVLSLQSGDLFRIGSNTFDSFSLPPGNATFKVYTKGEFTLV